MEPQKFDRELSELVRNSAAELGLDTLNLTSGAYHGAKALVVPSNVSLVPLPPRAPELNGQENIWQFMGTHSGLLDSSPVYREIVASQVSLDEVA